MYLRHSVIRKNGKAHTYWRLVRSVRVGKKVRQETVAELGALDFQGRLKAQALAKRLGAEPESPGLFDPSLEKEVAEVRLNAVGLERVRRFGDSGTTISAARQGEEGLGLDPWKAYIQLTDVEDAFRMQKWQLEIQPGRW